MALITESQQKVLNSMCQGAKNVLLGDLLVALQNQPTLNADVVFTTNGAAVALTAAKNVGFVSFVQAAPDVAAQGGSIYVLCTDQHYSSQLGLSMVSTGAVPAVSAVQVVGEGLAGGVATITLVSAAGADYITLTCPGISTAVVITAGTNGANLFTVAGGDATAASNLALCINKTTAAAGYVAEFVAFYAANGVMPFTALAIGTCVVLVANYAGSTIKSHNATKETIVTDVLNTVDVARTMQPGVVLQFAVGVTATVPATGNELKLALRLQR